MPNSKPIPFCDKNLPNSIELLSSDTNWATPLLVRTHGHNIPTSTGCSVPIPINHRCIVRDVWADNLEKEFKTIRKIVSKYNYVALDTEYPGNVVKPVDKIYIYPDYQYQLLRRNVDLLRIIQVGFSFFDENGNPPAGTYITWQFNFQFNLREDIYALNSIELLKHSGIQFEKHEEKGIDPIDFAELLMTSGIVLMENIKWISFQGGHDFGYLLKMLTGINLPDDDKSFFQMLKIYFPSIYDIKYLSKCRNCLGGLQEVSHKLGLIRIGPQHQAGSDSLLTGMAFFKIREMLFEGFIDEKLYSNHLYGLGDSFTIYGKTYYVNGSSWNNNS